jgi:hypothetical protein
MGAFAFNHLSEFKTIQPQLGGCACGTFDDPTWFTPDRHIWLQSKLPWVTIPEGVSAYMQGATGAPL